MQSDLEKSAIFIVVVFGALTLGGLMAATIAGGSLDGFLFAIGASTAAWAAGYAILFDRPGAFRWLLVLAVLMAVASTVALVI